MGRGTGQIKTNPSTASAAGILPALAAPLRRSRMIRMCAAQFRCAAAKFVDGVLNISTSHPASMAIDCQTHYYDAVPYEAIDYLVLPRFLRALQFRPRDVVVDVGCGMGRFLCAAARFRVRQCIGIEFNARLAQCAERNARRLRGRISDIEIRCEDAARTNFRHGTIIWMFNPFGARTLDAVLRRLGSSLRRSPRFVQIAYINPVHEERLKAVSWLRCAHRVEPDVFCRFGASYWTNQFPT